MEALINAMNASVNPSASNSPESQTSPKGEGVDPGHSPNGDQDPGQEAVLENKNEPLSPRLAALIKRENSLIKKEREFKQRESELSKAAEGKLTRDELMKSLMDEFEEDPYEFMSKNGFSYEKLQNRLLSGDEGLKVNKLEKKIETLMRQLEEKENLKKSQAEEDEENDYRSKKDNAIKYIEKELLTSEDFELVAKEGAFELVYDVIQEHYEKTSKILSVSEAAELVEKHLEDDFKKRLEYNKVKKWTTPSQDDPSKSLLSEQSSPEPKVTKTITSDMLPTSSSAKSDLELTDEERMEKAIRIMKGEIKL